MADARPIKWTRNMLERRAWFTAGRVFNFVCHRCGATSITMADQCSADLADRCPGFEATEAAHQEFEANYHAIINGAPERAR
jgi:ribosomal protein L40E